MIVASNALGYSFNRGTFEDWRISIGRVRAIFTARPSPKTMSPNPAPADREEATQQQQRGSRIVAGDQVCVTIGVVLEVDIALHCNKFYS